MSNNSAFVAQRGCNNLSKNGQIYIDTVRGPLEGWQKRLIDMLSLNVYPYTLNKVCCTTSVFGLMQTPRPKESQHTCANHLLKLGMSELCRQTDQFSYMHVQWPTYLKFS